MKRVGLQALPVPLLPCWRRYENCIYSVYEKVQIQMEPQLDFLHDRIYGLILGMQYFYESLRLEIHIGKSSDGNDCLSNLQVYKLSLGHECRRESIRYFIKTTIRSAFCDDECMYCNNSRLYITPRSIIYLSKDSLYTSRLIAGRLSTISLYFIYI